MYFLHAINSDRQTRLLNVLGQIAMVLGDGKKLNLWRTVDSFPIGESLEAVWIPKPVGSL